MKDYAKIGLTVVGVLAGINIGTFILVESAKAVDRFRNDKARGKMKSKE